MRHSLRQRRSPSSAALLFIGIAALAMPMRSAPAQGTDASYSKAIDAALAEIGGIAKASTSKTQAPVGRLAQNLVLRAQLFEDLYEYSALLGRDFARLRDSIGKSGGQTIAGTQYFLARSLQELNQRRDAGAAYRNANASAPDKLRGLATAWSATLGATGGTGWQQDVTDWRAGRPVSTTTCAAANLTCALFKAILSGDGTSILRAEKDLLQNRQPDYSEVVTVPNGTPFTVDFFDPLPFYLLSQADYALLAYATKDQAGADFYRGIGLVRSGRSKEAEPMLRAWSRTHTGADAVFFGEALYRIGNKAEAEQVWRTATGYSANLLADTRSLLEYQLGASEPSAAAASAARQYGVESSDFRRLNQDAAGGKYLARALLRVGRTDDAIRVLEGVLPASASVGSDLDKAPGDVLAIVARARYLAGATLRRNYEVARGALGALATSYPIVDPVLHLLQQITVPPNVSSVRSGP